MAQTTTSIAIAFDSNFRHAASIFRGVADYLSEHQLDWRLIPLQIGFEAKLYQIAQSHQLVGAIGTFVSDNWLSGLTQHGLHAVNLFNFSKITSVPTVTIHDFALGQIAARHLLRQGATRFTFYGSDSIHFTQLRLKGFKNKIPNQAIHLWDPSMPFSENLRTSTGSATGPVGIFCNSDRLAREIILEAQKHKLVCGRDLLVLGVDNDPSESIFAGIEISSFELPVHACGYRAAKILHAQLNEKALPSGPHHPGKLSLLPRESTLPSNRARLTQRAQQIISDHLAAPGLDAASLARRAGASRRSLELALQSQLQTSPFRLITRARVHQARQLLRSTRLPIMEVGRRSGYPEPHHFSAWFKKHCACSPKAFRTKAPSV
ncbi:MAG: helix-turn-helix domain-containing protein [Verrucomicrobia bacterium]|nr:helix-turn-helix domain-containing protein [Verrucomicrobiota bacterium]